MLLPISLVVHTWKPRPAVQAIGAAVKLVALEIEGFRGYTNKTGVEFDDLTVLAGKNDAGKSTVFDALKLFLGKAKPDPLDHSVNGTGTIRISCTFTNLPPSLVIDNSAPTTLAEEYLLNADGDLTIQKSWARGKTAPEVSARAVHPVGTELPLLIGLKQAALKKLAGELALTESLEDRRVNLNYRRAIWKNWEQEGISRFDTVEIPLNVEDGKQVALALESVFPIFHLFQADRAISESEDVAQDPAKLVVESVLDRHTERLAALTADVQAEVIEMLGNVVDRLEEIAPELASKLSPIDIKPNWQKAFSAVQFVDENQVPLAKRGSGTRRLVLLSFFRAEVERGYEENTTWRRGIIIAVEEPETALHPDLQRETLAALSDVSALPNRQVLLTTHSSNLVRDIPIDAVRFVENVGGQRTWFSQKSAPDRQILEHLTVTMGTFADHNVRCFLIVEGKNDIAGLLHLSDGIQAFAPGHYPDLRELERRGELCFIPIGGCGAAALWESRLSPFRRKEVHLLDSDRTSAGEPLKESVGSYVRRYEEARNPLATVAVLERREMENYLTKASIEAQFNGVEGFEESFRGLVALADWNYADIPMLVAEALHSVRSPKNWSEMSDEKKSNKESAAKRDLAECFAHPTVAEALHAEEKSDLMEVLGRIDSPEVLVQ